MYTNGHEWMPCVMYEEEESPGAEAQECVEYIRNDRKKTA